MNKILQAKIKIKTLVNVSDISEFTINSDFNKKIKKLVTKVKLKEEKEKIVKFQTFDSSYFYGKSHIEDNGNQNLVFQPIYRFFKKITNINQYLLHLIIVLFHP